jgi:ABC-type glycerol-3-phosphate transport system substrate-binding protein
MSRRKSYCIVAGAVLVAMLLASCAPQVTPTPERVVETVVVKETEVVTEEVEVEVEVTAVPEEPVIIEVWSHFATEPTKQEAIKAVFNDYMMAHPNVIIDVMFWDKSVMFPAFQAAMTAGGKGAPDMAYFEVAQADWTDAGWFEDISDVLDFDKQAEGCADSVTANYALGVSVWMDVLLYNPDIFAELGIEVPEDRQFSYTEFLDVVETCNEAGYSGLANASADRDYPGQYIPSYLMLSLVGPEESNEYYSGHKSWDTPEGRQVVEAYVELIDAGLYPEDYASVGIDEFHVNFHTKKSACMLALGSWYTGRAFKAEEEGGQSPDFRFSFLEYPLMEGGAGANLYQGGAGGGFGVVSTSDNKEIAKDIIAFWQQPKYGAIWANLTSTNSVLLFEESDVPQSIRDDPGIAQWSWFWEEINKVYGDDQLVIQESACGDFGAAYVTVMDEALPLGLMGVDEAIEYLDAHLCTE